MSLTSLLDAKGPVRSWFEANLGEARKITSAANPRLRDGPSDTPCVLVPPPGTDHALVGTAVGYVISAHVREGALDRTVATNGASLITPEKARSRAIYPVQVEHKVVARITELAPWRQTLPDTEWRELCSLCGILARFEACFRAGMPVYSYALMPVLDHGDDLAAIAEDMVSPASLTDLSDLGRAAIEDHQNILHAERAYLGPTFVQSLRLGGADADVIYDGVLIDFKSTSRASVMGRADAWQLAGYLLADTDNRYGIERVALSALRRRQMVLWDAQDFLDQLAGEPTKSVEDWRSEFAALLATVAPDTRLLAIRPDGRPDLAPMVLEGMRDPFEAKP